MEESHEDNNEEFGIYVSLEQGGFQEELVPAIQAPIMKPLIVPGESAGALSASYALSPSYSSPSLSTMSEQLLDSEPLPRTRSSDKLPLERKKPSSTESQKAISPGSKTPLSPFSEGSINRNTERVSSSDEGRRVSDEIKSVMSVFGIVPVKSKHHPNSSSNASSTSNAFTHVSKRCESPSIRKSRSSGFSSQLGGLMPIPPAPHGASFEGTPPCSSVSASGSTANGRSASGSHLPPTPPRGPVFHDGSSMQKRRSEDNLAALGASHLHHGQSANAVSTEASCTTASIKSPYSLGSARCVGEIVRCSAVALCSPDGHKVVTAGGSGPGSIRVVSGDLPFQVLQETPGHSSYVFCICVVNENLLASGGYEVVKLWNSNTFQCVGVMKGHQGYIYSICPVDTSRIATGSNDKTIRIWSVVAGYQCLAVLRGHNDWVRALCALPGKRFASGSDDSTIKIWSSKSGHACLTTFTGHDNWILCLCALPEDRIASGSRDNTIKIWSCSSGLLYGIKTSLLATITGHTSSIRSLCAFPDGRLVSGSRDKSVRIWQLHYKKLGKAKDHERHSSDRLQDMERSSESRASHSRLSGDNLTALDPGIQSFGDLTMTTDAGHHHSRRHPYSNKHQPTCIGVIEGVEMGVYAAYCLENGNIVVSSEDHTIKLWSFSHSDSVDHSGPN